MPCVSSFVLSLLLPCAWRLQIRHWLSLTEVTRTVIAVDSIAAVSADSIAGVPTEVALTVEDSTEADSIQAGLADSTAAASGAAPRASAAGLRDLAALQASVADLLQDLIPAGLAAAMIAVETTGVTIEDAATTEDDPTAEARHATIHGDAEVRAASHAGLHRSGFA